MAERISLREFGRRLKVNEKSVRKAIEKKAIINGVEYGDNGRPRIVYEIALREWEAHVSLEGRDPKIDFTAAKKETHVRREQNEEPPVAEAGLERAATNTQKINHARSKVRLEMDVMELRKKKNELVEREKMNREFFEAGKIIREALLTIPDRVIDDIRAEEDRNVAHTMLYKEIEAALEKLSSMEAKVTEGTFLT